MGKPSPQLHVYSTCPQWSSSTGGTYVEHAGHVAAWSEEAGCEGMLIYANNFQVDPWMMATLLIARTRTLCPLVAVQPVYMHPFNLAKIISSIGYATGRRVCLNMVAGGFKTELEALGDYSPHDRRYDRLVEYTTVALRLLGGQPVTFEGEFYQVKGLKLGPALPEDLYPRVFMSGSSDAGAAAAKLLNATSVIYPKPAMSLQKEGGSLPRNSGVRVGIISRSTEQEAWSIARQRFPEDRQGKLTRQFAAKVSDSVWHKDLVRQSGTGTQGPYWLVPFENYKTMCPYLVGSHERVARELAGYIQAGCRTFILDIPVEADDLLHSRRVLDLAAQLCTDPAYSRTG